MANPFQSGKKPPALGRPGQKAAPVAVEVDTVETPESPKQEQRETSAKIEPQMVCFRTADEVCQSCSNWNGGQCSVLDMQTEAQDSCNAYQSGGAGPEQEAPEMVQA